MLMKLGKSHSTSLEAPDPNCGPQFVQPCLPIPAPMLPSSRAQRLALQEKEEECLGPLWLLSQPAHHPLPLLLPFWEVDVTRVFNPDLIPASSSGRLGSFIRLHPGILGTQPLVQTQGGPMQVPRGGLGCGAQDLRSQPGSTY